MTQVRIKGAEQLAILARRLKRYGDKELRSALYRAINRAAKPLKGDVKESAKKRLPRKGGLNKRVAGTKIATKRRMTGRSAGVRLVGTSGYDIRSIDRGRVRHLTWGHRPWHNQSVPPGFWTEPLVQGADKVREEIQGAMDDIAQKMREG